MELPKPPIDIPGAALDDAGLAVEPNGVWAQPSRPRAETDAISVSMPKESRSIGLASSFLDCFTWFSYCALKTVVVDIAPCWQELDKC